MVDSWPETKVTQAHIDHCFSFKRLHLLPKESISQTQIFILVQTHISIDQALWY